MIKRKLKKSIAKEQKPLLIAWPSWPLVKALEGHNNYII